MSGWLESFRRRHPQLTLRTAAPVSYARAVASDPAVISNYYDLLECTLVENNLIDKPAQIFNMDEIGMPLDPSPPLVVAQRGQKHPSAVGSGDKSQITVLSCCSAAGYALPPFVIFDRMALKPELTTGEVPGTVYGLSRKGWIDGKLFHLWFTRHFLAYAPPARPSSPFPHGWPLFTLSHKCNSEGCRRCHNVLSTSTYHAPHPASGQGVFWASQGSLA